MPFRSVARRVIEGLRGNDAVRLTVLRPPAFERLAQVLREAQAAGQPYHLVHFDGHGVWDGRGYLEFENQVLEGNRQLVDGSALGNLLAGTGVAALVLNACKSAYAAAGLRARNGRAGQPAPGDPRLRFTGPGDYGRRHGGRGGHALQRLRGYRRAVHGGTVRAPGAG